jgi:hypothetical protein
MVTAVVDRMVNHKIVKVKASGKHDPDDIELWKREWADIAEAGPSIFS